MRLLGNRSIVDLFFPKRCVLCDGTLSGEEEGICGGCIGKIKYIEGDVCAVCGRTVSDNAELCRECAGRKRGFLGGRFPLSYELIGDSVFRFKYANRPEYGAFYAKCIVERWREWIEAVDPDALIPVPLHKKRFNKRGYNQAEILAKEISNLINVPCLPGLVSRVKNTAPQKRFDRKQRQINVKKAFIVNENSVKLSTVIVVDDIFTTGSTIEALSDVLKKAGVKRVYFLTITAAET